jgi:UDP-N-acetylglucosamine transferase subunit ALG13
MKILFGVLDWGIGHSTRDIPLIDGLLKRGHYVDILSTGRALKILQYRFGKNCRYFDIPSVYSPYTKTRFWMLSYIISIPLMLSTLIKARKEVRAIIHREKYDKIISDNRLDVYGEKSQSYFISHVVRFKTFFLFQWIAHLVTFFYLSKYRTLFVPDFPSQGISGDLSHRLFFLPGKDVVYLGILTHIRKKKLPKTVDYFISLSGPEPQRSILQQKILQQIHNLSGEIVIAGANPDQNRFLVHKKVKYYSYLNQKKQEEMMNRSKVVITRSGYTTLMDLAEISHPQALIIPTPGQTEQEYLARYCERKKFFHHVDQSRLDLSKDLKVLKKYTGISPPWKTQKSVSLFLNYLFNENS